ncbi:MAG: hypothetical protein EOM90_13045 [Alphaproteobacteria bacterium]|nr:hypothetical protein [Alphaproteobacteria bacterium]
MWRATSATGGSASFRLIRVHAPHTWSLDRQCHEDQGKNERQMHEPMKYILFAMTCSLMVQATLTAQESVIIGQVKEINSAALGGEVRYHVHLPEKYAGTDEPFPVIYLINAQSTANFANACATVDNLSSERIPDMILVGISNTGVAGNYWSCPDDSGQLKPAARFYRFLEEELIPEINKNYRTTPYKILAGQSNSGLYVLNNLLFHPALFDAYVLASPMLGWCPGFLLNETRKFLDSNPVLNKRLYVDYGELDYIEVLDTIQEFEKILGRKSPEGFTWKLEMIRNDGHVPYASLHNALLFFFSGCTVTPEMRKFSIAQMKSHFVGLSKAYGFTVQPKGDVLFDMALNLKNEKKVDEAIEWFRYLVSLYPNTAIYYYGFGLTWVQKGDLTSAKGCFKKALEIDPEDARSKSMLEKIGN